jgi:hypothetical protein
MSDTPETDKLRTYLYEKDALYAVRYQEAVMLAQRLERQRNEARAEWISERVLADRLVAALTVEHWDAKHSKLINAALELWRAEREWKTNKP